jgi:NAD(P)-dependent dehydrogenase (short-subunit alcohol dehydrogenase family)
MPPSGYDSPRRVALVTGGSRGVGAATVAALASAGIDVAVNCREKVARAEAVAEAARGRGVRAIVCPADITRAEDRVVLIDSVIAEFGRLDVLVLNASGGMERDLAARDPNYAMTVNHDAQVALTRLALARMEPGSVIIHVTSHLAYFHGRAVPVPEYSPVAASKFAGEQALRAMRTEFETRGVRLAIVSGDLIDGTVVPRLMNRLRPGLIAARQAVVGTLPTVDDMARAILRAAGDESVEWGETLFVGDPALVEMLPAAAGH